MVSLLEGLTFGTLGLAGMAAYGAVAIQTLHSLDVYLAAREALDKIRLGDDSRKYRHQIQDAKIDSLAGALLGRRALFAACRAGRQYRIDTATGGLEL